MSDETYLTPEELSARLKNQVTVGTLKQWRFHKKGPAYTKAGNKVLYSLSSIIEWEQRNTVKTQGQNDGA